MNIAEHPEIGKAFRRLESLLSHTDSFVLAFVLYRDIKEQRENAAKLKDLIDLPVTEVALKGDNLNPVRAFLDLPKEPRQAIFYTFLGSSLPEGKSDFDKFAGYVNIQREAFTDAPHAVVLWLREEQLVRLMKRAPDFWAWRSGVFDVRGELEPGATNYQVLEEANAFERGDLEEQVALYREILKGQLERDEPDLAYIVRTRLRLVNALYKLGFYEIMAEEARETITLARTLDDDGMLSSALDSLAVAYQQMNNHDEAELLYHEALESDKKVSGKNQLGYAATLNNLGNLLRGTGRYDEAEPLYREALKITAKALGKEHPRHASGLNNLAELLRSTGRYDEAESLYWEAMEITAKTLGKKHPNYASGLNNLAALLANTGYYDKAEPLFHQGIEITAKTLGKEHPDYGFQLINLANLLRIVGRYEEAEPLFREALSILVDRLGEDHPNTQTVRQNYELFLQEREAQQTPIS